MTNEWTTQGEDVMSLEVGSWIWYEGIAGTRRKRPKGIQKRPSQPYALNTQRERYAEYSGTRSSSLPNVRQRMMNGMMLEGCVKETRQMRNADIHNKR